MKATTVRSADHASLAPILASMALLCGAGLSLAGQQSAGEPAPPVASAARTSNRITVDGALDEADWLRASPLSGFTQRLPAEGSPATQRSEVRILFDDENLYIGADLFDSRPETIIAREMKEDGNLRNDDLFGVILDTFHDRRNGFYFETNPNGARGDALIYDEGRTQSFDWDGVWDVASCVNDHGWSVEMVIPFKTLHFDPEKTNPWGLQIWRFIRRETEDVFWAPVPRAEDLFRISRAGELRGLEGIRQGKSLALKPYALGAVKRQPSFDQNAADGTADVGLDARYDLTPNLAAVLTVNTDFAETEVDEQQINTTRFPLFFPEKREFFLESTGYFDFGFNRNGLGAPPGLLPFFSRRIGLDPNTGTPVPIMAGAKLVGRMGRYNLGFLSVNTNGSPGTSQTNVTTLRVSRDILTRSNWGIIGVSKEPVGSNRPGDPNDETDDIRWNRTYGADLNFSVLQNFKLGGSYLGTRTPGVAHGGDAMNAYANWSNDDWKMEFTYRDIGANFNPEVGFVQRKGIEEAETFLGWTWRSDTAPVRLIEPHSRFTYTMDQNHELATRRQHWATSVEFRDGSTIEVGYNPMFDEIVNEPFILRDGDGDPNTRSDNVEIRPGAYHPTQWLILYEGNQSRVLSGEAFVEFGDFFDGGIRSYDVTGIARFSRHLRGVLGVHRAEIDLPSRPDDPSTPLVSEAIDATRYNTTLLQGRLGVSFSTRLFFDALLQYNTDIEDFSSNLRVNYKYRPGSDIYVVYNERRDIEGLPGDIVDRTFTVKWTYLMAF